MGRSVSIDMKEDYPRLVLMEARQFLIRDAA